MEKKTKTLNPKDAKSETVNTPEKKEQVSDFVPEEVHIKETIIKNDVKREQAIKILQEQHKKQKL